MILDGGGINAFGGRVELGGLAESGEVELNFNGNNLNLKFPDIVARANVSVINGARAIVIGKGSGSIAIDAKDINISGRDTNIPGGLFAGIAPKLGVTNSQGGDITLNATGAITVTNSGRVSNFVRAGSEGIGGNINVNASSLFLRNSSALQALNFGVGKVGDVNIDVSDGVVTLVDDSLINSILVSGAEGKSGNVTIKGRSLFLSDNSQVSTSTLGRSDAGNILVKAFESIFLESDSRILSTVQAGGEGNGGEIEIYTGSLSAMSGSVLAASVRSYGKGKGGNILINASDSVNLSGYSKNDGYSSGLLASTAEEASGSAGNIIINTSNLRIADGAAVNVQTLNDSDGGNVTINATTFEAVNGGQIINTTGLIRQEGNKTRGNAGSITINVSDRITLSGSDSNFTERSNNPEFTDRVQNEGAASGIFASTRKNSEGSAGNIAIATGKLTIRDGAEITARATGGGQAGSVTVNSDTIQLDRGTITASTNNGTGGNVFLDANNLLLMSNNSLISAEANNQANGGNINIDARFIFAIPDEDSNITANAFEGKGGNINITTEGIFGIQFRQRNTLLSDITASSQFGVQGRVSIAEPNVDFSKTIVQLPTFIDRSGQIAKGCSGQGSISEEQLSSFTITGRGGLPPSPTDPRSSEAVLTNWATLATEGESETANVETTVTTEKIAKPIVEAQGWVRDSTGEIVLFAQVSNITSYSPTMHSNNCSGLRDY